MILRRANARRNRHATAMTTPLLMQPMGSTKVTLIIQKLQTSAFHRMSLASLNALANQTRSPSAANLVLTKYLQHLSAQNAVVVEEVLAATMSWLKIFLISYPIFLANVIATRIHYPPVYLLSHR
jgi:hypothetical protein